MYQGSCLCGAVRFEIDGAIRDIIHCHCSQCRKAQGSAFATNGNVAKRNFRFLCGEDRLTSFEAAPGHHKLFCSACGSPMLSTNAAHPDWVRVRLGTIESPIDERPGAHIFMDSKANWDELDAALPQFPEYPSD